METEQPSGGAIEVVPAAPLTGGDGGLATQVQYLRQNGNDLVRILADHDARKVPISEALATECAETCQALMSHSNIRLKAVGAKLVMEGLKHNLKLLDTAVKMGEPKAASVSVNVNTDGSAVVNILTIKPPNVVRRIER